MIPVLHLRSSQGLYGADQALLALASATQPPFRPLVVSLARPGGPDLLSEAARARGLDTEGIPSAAKVDWNAVRMLLRLCQTTRVQLIHAHDYKALALALAVRPFSHAPVVATYHGDTGATPALRAYETLAHGLGNLTSGIAAVSRPLWEKLQRRILAAPVAYIPNGIATVTPPRPEERVEARRKLGIPEETFVAAVLGRLSVEKGHRVLLEALKMLPTAPLTLVAGEGPLRRVLESESASLSVRFLGFLENPRPLYAAADLIILPSLTEGLPLVALEAMAHERPVLATSVGDVPMLLDNGAGVCVPPADARKLAEALAQLMASPERRSHLARCARVRVQARYSVAAMASAYAEALYAPALAFDGIPAPSFNQSS